MKRKKIFKLNLYSTVRSFEKKRPDRVIKLFDLKIKQYLIKTLSNRQAISTIRMIFMEYFYNESKIRQ